VQQNLDVDLFGISLGRLKEESIATESAPNRFLNVGDDGREPLRRIATCNKNMQMQMPFLRPFSYSVSDRGEKGGP
jgi:hypothetical protein